MNRQRNIERLLWTAAVVASAYAVVGWRQAISPMPPFASPPLTSLPMPQSWPTDSLANAGDIIVAGDPFRLERQPAAVPYHAASDGAPPPPTSPIAARPALAAVGFVGGSTWAALITGLPGNAGSVVVKAGDIVGDLTVLAVGRDSVVVQGMDTTWILTLKHPWR